MGAIPSNAKLIDTVEGHRAVQVDRQRHRRRHRFGDGARRAARGFSVSNAYLDAGVEILNGTKTPQQAMDDIRAVALQAKAKM